VFTASLVEKPKDINYIVKIFEGAHESIEKKN